MVKVGVCRVTACYNEKKRRGEVISKKRLEILLQFGDV